jgi:ubiquinone/menaquinone biosynthesis C-methylase UbiE
MSISMFNFQEFVYAKKSHLSLLHNYEQELYKRRIDFTNSDLKKYQDLLVFAFIKQNIPPGTRMLEVGGGYSRLLEYFCKDYECWNIDPFEGVGTGPTVLKPVPYRLVRDYMGNFNAELPDNYFDIVFSISALEHIPTDQTMSKVINDINRVLKIGGYSLHALDSVVKDNQFNFLHPFTFKVASQPNSLIKLPDTAEILKDPDIYFMTKEAYDYGWKHITKEEYEAFGSPTSINLLWVKS